jgi:hypothetical protein
MKRQAPFWKTSRNPANRLSGGLSPSAPLHTLGLRLGARRPVTAATACLAPSKPRRAAFRRAVSVIMSASPYWRILATRLVGFDAFGAASSFAGFRAIVASALDLERTRTQRRNSCIKFHLSTQWDRNILVLPSLGPRCRISPKLPLSTTAAWLIEPRLSTVLRPIHCKVKLNQLPETAATAEEGRWLILLRPSKPAAFLYGSHCAAFPA